MSASAPRAFPRSPGRSRVSRNAVAPCGLALALAVLVIGAGAGVAIWKASSGHRPVVTPALGSRPLAAPVRPRQDQPPAAAGAARPAVPNEPAPARAHAAGPVRKILVATAGIALAMSVGLVGTGTTYALWNGETAVNASTVTSGSASLSINGTTNYAIPLDLTKIGPGQSVWTPLTVRNTGTTALSAVVSSTTVTAQTNGLADNLVITLTQSATCAANLSGGVTAQLATFNTTASPYVMAVGSTVQLCLEAKMNAAAPMTVQGGTANFSLTLDAVQVR